MLTNIPTPTDFEQSGIAFLNFAYDATMTVALSLADRHTRLDNLDLVLEHATIVSNQKHLAIALALGQQGAELLLKSKIVAIEPVSILSDSAEYQKATSDKKNVSFCDLKTIDSQVLVMTS